VLLETAQRDPEAFVRSKEPLTIDEVQRCPELLTGGPPLRFSATTSHSRGALLETYVAQNLIFRASDAREETPMTASTTSELNLEEALGLDDGVLGGDPTAAGVTCRASGRGSNHAATRHPTAAIAASGPRR
jgi:hypothetical protein